MWDTIQDEQIIGPCVGWTNLEEVGVPTEHGHDNKSSSHIYMTTALKALQFSTKVLKWAVFLIGPYI